MIEGYFDGGCWENPGGHASCGCYIVGDTGILLEEGYYIGHGESMSNNVAEYEGLIRVLEFLLDEHKDSPIVIFGDSMLVIKQMSGSWKIKKGFYASRARQAKELATKFTSITFRWIPRDENTICDKLAEAAMHG
ncbi:MAG: ribonuclease HI family protein [Planctomycetes bacterium]|nr:ribonuclease HI family protein [Planctomycetota bacterium]